MQYLRELTSWSTFPNLSLSPWVTKKMLGVERTKRERIVFFQSKAIYIFFPS